MSPPLLALPGLTDTHCHLPRPGRKNGPTADAILERARAAGVTGFVVVGVGESTAEAHEAIATAQAHHDVVAAVGVHPHEARHCDDRMFDEFAGLSTHESVVAVGEIGLDYHYDYSPRPVQQAVFRRFLELAKLRKKPIVIHTREASEDTLCILEEHGAGAHGGIIHCFSENRAFAKRALDSGFHLSFSGIVTFPKAIEVQEVAKWAPLDRILVETDAPYLAPVPHRGRPCEPAYVVWTARFLATLRGCSAEAIAEQTTANAQRLFPSLRAAPLS